MFYSTALGDHQMGLNIAIGDLDEKAKGTGNFGNFHHEDWLAGRQGTSKTQLRYFASLWMRAQKKK